MDLAGAIKQLEETAIVMAGIQPRQAEVLKGHGQWLEQHTLAVASHDREIAEIREIQRQGDERLNALIAVVDDMIRKKP